MSLRPVAARSARAAPRMPAWVAGLLLLVLGCTLLPVARADSLRYCDPPVGADLAQQSRLLRLTALLRERLDASGAEVALLARSGLALSRFGVRYTHAGLAVRQGLATPWGVRQLYFACDERRPRLYDQGLAGFVQGLSHPARGHLSVLLLPPEAAGDLRRTLLDTPLVLRLLAPQYSANAYPFSTRYQNCNQWVAEVLALAWGGLAASTGAPAGADALRTRAQTWLQAEGYRPTVFEVTFPPVRWLGMVSWLHLDDHPPEALDGQRLAVSMPAALDAFVQGRWPGAQRLSLCQAGDRLVVRRGSVPLPDDCTASGTDEVLALD